MTTPQALAAATNALDEEAFQALYGRWDPLEPTAIAQLLASAPVRWHIAGGRAARHPAGTRTPTWWSWPRT